MRELTPCSLLTPCSPLLQDCRGPTGRAGSSIHPDDASMLIVRAFWTRLRH